MKWHRIKGLLVRHLYLYQRSIPRIMDIFYWPLMELLLWGFLSLYLSKIDVGGFNAVAFLLGALLFWDLLNQSQKAMSVGFLEDVWERNLLNIFVTPLKVSEFLVATFLLASLRILMVSVVLGVLAIIFYHFNVLMFGIYLIPFFLNLLLFGWSLGLLTTAIILRYGTSAQVLAWGFIFLLQPFTAVFYPVSALPEFIQPVAWLFPSTYIFEGMRSVISTGSLDISLLGLAFGLNLVYLILISWIFMKAFSYVKNKGKLMKLND